MGSYAFDAQGRRKSKTASGTTTLYFTDADNREVLEYDGASGAVQRWSAYGAGSNDVLSQMNVAAATCTTLIPDIQGSVLRRSPPTRRRRSRLLTCPMARTAPIPPAPSATPPAASIPEAVAASQPSGFTYMRANLLASVGPVPASRSDRF
ncbi:hypothetical protein [Tardibacter chloracetimidivorans]|uniref:hypothetical protein n=1 Tax=Tardibacter chloracetimidivorans TaxID=1921510 RepID=UPI001300E9D5|nr:hypothetical protein [Tardibacter chloracetimidivorans]